MLLPFCLTLLSVMCRRFPAAKTVAVTEADEL